ncbi:hypothetical protein AK812_SmicGene6029 [Symbiodinium microadriaticum]|uniref:Uncharacterized protein n=1 Tax=Symbiodinium microadriaticum TaxID=2951 RepID=A0A1Q9ES53_SYMMI|nr:hypothetical protein AK812_SmicGene6029 [Symbiodinium microadriaticum]
MSHELLVEVGALEESDRNVDCEFGHWRRDTGVMVAGNRAGTFSRMEEVDSCTMEPCGAARDCESLSTAKNGGAECPEADLEETGECNTQDCVANAWGKAAILQSSRKYRLYLEHLVFLAILFHLLRHGRGLGILEQLLRQVELS